MKAKNDTSKLTVKKVIWMSVFLVVSLMWTVDPFNWGPIDHLSGKGRIACTPEDTRPTCKWNRKMALSATVQKK